MVSFNYLCKKVMEKRLDGSLIPEFTLTAMLHTAEFNQWVGGFNFVRIFHQLHKI